MSKTQRLTLIRARFAALHCLASLPAAVAGKSSIVESVARAHSLPLHVMPAHRESILTPAERATLARDVACLRAFRADCAALPLRLMPAPFFAS